MAANAPGSADVPADHRTETESVTRDGFHRGAFHVLQPTGFGHRSGSDALLLAASLPEGACGSLADLGAGAGVAALAALSMNPQLNAVLVEIDPVMVGIAQDTLKLAGNEEIASRAQVLQADATLSGERRAKAGLQNNSFDHVIMNPPYNHADQRRPADPTRALAHMIGAGGLEPWMRTAAAIIRPGGILHLIYRTEKLGEVIAAAQGRFGDIRILPLHARADAAASRFIVRARRGSRGALAMLPGLILHDESDQATELADAALNGRARLF